MHANHSAHNYQALMDQWRTISQKNSLLFNKLTVYDQFPVFEISNQLVRRNEPALYISAGIHGDEVGACWGLLDWAKQSHDILTSIPIILFPCLNPWGFVHNSRTDKRGQDLNRIWGMDKHPFTEKIFLRLEKISILLSLNLHEDFDANGIYLYDPYIGNNQDSWADNILKAGKKSLPLDKRETIEGRSVNNGVIRPRIDNPPEDGIPEALYLVEKHGSRNFTIETPSEESLRTRISAQLLMIEEAVRLAF